MFGYRGYLGVADYDLESGIMHGAVAGIRDVVTFQGESAEQAERAFQDSVDDYLEFCKSRGEEPNAPAGD